MVRSFGPSCPALSVSANSSALSNSMHVLMKHCWPAAHCQLHCCLDDWSIEGLRGFCRATTTLCAPTAVQPPSSSAPGFRFESTRHRDPRAPDPPKARPTPISAFLENVQKQPVQEPAFVSFNGVQPTSPLYVTLGQRFASFAPTKATTHSSCSTLFLSIVSVSDLSRAKRRVQSCSNKYAGVWSG